MGNAKKKRFRVRFHATLPASATLEVEASSEAEAREVAYRYCMDADWDVPDYERPSPSVVEIADIERIS